MGLLLENYDILEYIQSSGAQRIKTNIQLQSYGVIELCASITDITKTSCLWCCRGTSTSDSSLTAFYIANTGLRGDYYNDTSSGSLGSYAANTPFILIQDGRRYKVNGVIKKTYNNRKFNAKNQVEFFASYTNGQDSGLGNYSYMKFYWCRIYNSTGNLVGFFVPVKRKSDGVLGLYNTVNDVFYANQGSGSFTAGSVKGLTLNADLYDKNLLYQKCEYIQTNGAQYIDTYIVPTSTTKIELVEQYTSLSGTMLNGTMGTYRFHFGFYNSAFHPGMGNGYGTAPAWNTNKNTVVMDVPNKRMQINGINYPTSGWTSPTSDWTMPSTKLFLGARNDSGSATNYTNTQKIYSFKYYSGSTLSKSLVPVYRKADGKGGMLDSLSGTFYENRGSGNFTCVPCTDLPIDNVKYNSTNLTNVQYNSTLTYKALYRPVAYIQSTGSQYINTGVAYSSGSLYEHNISFDSAYKGTRQLMGFNGNTATYWGITASGYIEMDAVTNNNAVYGIDNVTNVRYLAQTSPLLEANESTIHQAQNAGFSGYYNLFRLNGGSYYCYCKLYSFKIIDQNGVLRFDGVPVLRLLDNKAGLLNRINESFYPSGNGSFSYGEQ